MDLLEYLILSALGVASGFLNVMAGGGSLITLPAMIVMGLPPAVANGTNRVALVAQNLTAVRTFHRGGLSDFKTSLSLGLCTLPGVVAGSLAAIDIDPLWFKRLLALLMVAVLLATLRKSMPSPGRTGQPSGTPRPVAAHIAMVGIGFYGGFVQAGAGFILMAVLSGLLRADLVRTNMHKVFIVGMYMLPSLLIFAAKDQVLWPAGGFLAAGNAAGAWVATRTQIERGEGVVRWVFAVAVLAMAVKLVLD